ncbi:DUF433 domain-containing protein [Leptodesmis sp.]|uniref:DUF433 domain-containing protein n=1 Tax=Leptodesmis sp. TaxID=3100501 RepID=UPI004053570D
MTHSLDRNWRGIAKTPGVCGGDACIAGTRIPVWMLVDYRRLGTSDSELLNHYPTLSATDLANAWVYAQTHPKEIELAIRENDESKDKVN